MLVSLTVGKVDAGVTVLLTPDKRLIEFPSILLPPNISSGSIVDITVSQNATKEDSANSKFRALQDRIYNAFGASEPTTPVLRCCNATQTSVVLEWDPVELATADLISLSLYRNGQKAGNIPRPMQMQSTKISGLAVDTEYTFHLVLRTTAGTYTSEKMAVRTHKMTDLSGITITPGIMPGATREKLNEAVERIGAKIADGVRIDTSHFVTTEGRGQTWEKAVENNIPVVRPEWVEACEKNGRILGVAKFYLDAMMPGPTSEDGPSRSPAPAPAPAPPPKDEPEAETQNGGDASRHAEAGEAVGVQESERHGVESSEDDGDEDRSDAGEVEQKVKSPTQDEQKVRLEDVQEQKFAMRPASSSRERGVDEEAEDREQGTGSAKDESGSDEDEVERKDQPARTPDGASFQDVEL